MGQKLPVPRNMSGEKVMFTSVYNRPLLYLSILKSRKLKGIEKGQLLNTFLSAKN